MIVLDSYGWIEYFGDGPLAGKYSPYLENARPETHITPAIVLHEVYKKLKRERGEEIALKAIAYIMSYTKVVSLDERISVSGAEISLKTGLAMADSIIKATADAFEAKIATSDPDFKSFAGIIFIV